MNTIHHALVLNLHQPAGNLQALFDSDPWEAKEILYALDRIPRTLWGYEDGDNGGWFRNPLPQANFWGLFAVDRLTGAEGRIGAGFAHQPSGTRDPRVGRRADSPRRQNRSFARIGAVASAASRDQLQYFLGRVLGAARARRPRHLLGRT